MDKDKQETPFGTIAIVPEPDQDQAGPVPDEPANLSVAETSDSFESADMEAVKEAPPVRRPPRKRKFSWWRRPLIFLAAFYSLYVVAGYTLIPYLLRTLVPHRLSVMTERPITIGSASFNPFNSTVVLYNAIVGPKLTDPQDTVDPLLSFSSCKIDFEVVSLFKRGIVCKEFLLDKLFVHLVRRSDSEYNIMELFPPALSSLRFSLNNFSLTGGRLLFNDQPAGKTHTVDDIVLALPTLSNFSYQVSEYINPQFSARVNGSPVSITGRTELAAAGIDTRLHLQLDDLDLPSYLAYLPLNRNFSLSGGKAGFAVDLIFSDTKPAAERLQLEGSVSIADLQVQDRQGKPLASVPHLTVSGIVYPTAGRYRLHDLVCKKPEINVERGKDGQLGLWPLISGLWRPEGTDDSEPVDVSIKHLAVEAGTVLFVDRTVEGGLADRWSNINVTVEDLVSGDTGSAKRPAPFELSADHDSSTNALQARGTLTAFPLQLEGDVTLKNLDLLRYQLYLVSSLPAQHRIAKGWAAVAGRLAIARTAAGDSPQMVLQNVTFTVKDLQLAKDESNWFKAVSLEGREARVDSKVRRVDLGKIIVDQGRLELGIDRRGRFVLGPDLTDEGGQVKAINGQSGGESSGREWHANLQSLTVKRSVLRMSAAPNSPTGSLILGNNSLPSRQSLSLNLDDMFLQVSDLPVSEENRWRRQVAVSAAFNSGHGNISCIGPVNGPEFSAEIECSAREIELVPMAPFIENWFAPQVTGGVLRAEGMIRLPVFSFIGEVEVDGLTAEADGRQLVELGRSVGRGVRFSPAETSCTLEGLDIEEPVVTWHTTENGKSNLSRIFSPASAPDGSRRHGRYAIGEITMTRGTLVIADLSVEPPYRTTITGGQGKINSLVNQPDNHAGFSFQGLVDGSKPMSLAGEIGLFDPQFFVRHQLAISGLNLTVLSPYLEPYLGVTVAGGKVDLSMNYRQEKGRVTANTHLLVHDFQLGDEKKQDNNMALLVALLTDEDGRLILDIPVNGNITKSGFSLRREVLRMLRSYQVKATISPSVLLKDALPPGSPSGAGGGLERISFSFGSAELAPGDKVGLIPLAQALRKRPLLTVTIKGYADARSDREAILAKRRKEKTFRQVVEDIRLSEAISETYGREEIVSTDPVEASGSSETGRATLEALKVTDAELLELAGQRCLAVRQYLVDVLKIDGARIAINPQAELIPQNSPGQAGNRVDFLLGSRLAAR
jgi:hypothetical protein